MRNARSPSIETSHTATRCVHIVLINFYHPITTRTSTSPAEEVPMGAQGGAGRGEHFFFFLFLGGGGYSSGRKKENHSTFSTRSIVAKLNLADTSSPAVWSKKVLATFSATLLYATDPGSSLLPCAFCTSLEIVFV